MAENNDGYMNDFEGATMTLTLDDGKDVECEIVAVFPIEDQDYIALCPVESNDNMEIYFYKYFEAEDGEPSIDNILDDDEYEMVVDAFDELLDDEEFDDTDE